MSLGYNIKTTFESKVTMDRHLYPEYYDAYSIDEIYGYEPIEYDEVEPESRNIQSKEIESFKQLTEPLDGPMDSAWPMYCHDLHHTGRSPYSTADNPGLEKWRLRLQGLIWGSPIIDDNGIIYVGAWDFYAIYPNGTIKWQLDISAFSSAAAIDENGIIYVGTIWAMPNYLYAIYSGNGTIKWKYKTSDVYSSPVIGDDGTIYFGDTENWRIKALYPNGTLKWVYKTGHVVYSSPAIGQDGTVYCGSHDNYLYALYPNNGTLKWKYKTGHWIRTSPCVGDNGTIYCVSLDGYLHAVYPNNGTRKWRTKVGGGTSPTIGQDGTIYCGYSKLYTIDPTDGSIKWTFNVGGNMRGSTPCNSFDGTIYLGNSDGSDIVTVNPDGTEKWRKSIGGDVESAPCIGEDGTVYIGDGTDDGRFYAFGELDPNAPTSPNIDGPSTAKEEITKTFYFTSTSPFDRDVSYYVEWGDGKKTGWNGPHKSGEKISLGHAWGSPGSYTIKARAKDTDNLWGPWGEFEIEITRPRTRTSSHWMQLLDMFPMLQRILGIFL